MADSKQDVLDMLRELAELTLLEEGDPQSFRVRAYESAAQAIAAQATDLGRLTIADLKKIEGIGKSTAEKVHELLTHGKVQKLDELREKHPRSVVALLQIQGLGPKAVKKLRAELGVGSIDDLRKALAEHRVRGLSGFGVKSEQKLADALARFDEQGSQGRTPISVALPLANRIVARMLEVPGVTHASYCGSLRRFCETIGDVDIVVAASDSGPVMDALVSMIVVDRVLVRGDAKTSVVTQRGTQVDLRVVAESQLGAARLYFTGSKGHNIKLRQRALTRGLTLNEYALSEIEGGRIVASETEEQIYAALGLAFIPPMLREDQGEIEAAESGTLPKPIRAVLGDFHVHTTVSGDGRSPLEEVVMTAKQRGYAALAITDHAENTVSGVSREALLEQRAKIRALAAQLGGSLRLLHGVELNIGPKGELDYDDAFRRAFDFTLASVHDHFELGKAEQTARIVTAMRDPSVRMIGHLSARMIGGRPPIDLDLDAILEAAEATGTALEINGALPRLDLSVEALRRGRGKNVSFVLTSDAHHASELDRVENAAKNAERAWIEPEQIVNATSAERLNAWLDGSRLALRRRALTSAKEEHAGAQEPHRQGREEPPRPLPPGHQPEPEADGLRPPLGVRPAVCLLHRRAALRCAAGGAHMPKDPGTPDGVGLVHMPLLVAAYAVTYEQVGGFGPVTRTEAFKAIKQAGNIGRSRPDTVWVQKGSGGMDQNLTNAVNKAKAEYRIAAEIVKDGVKANEGWGVYYQFGRFVIVEHTSDPNSVVTVTQSGQQRQLPHFHIEEAPPGMIAATGKGHTFDVKRVERLGSASPLTPQGAKLNHHVYYVPLT